MFSSFGLKKIKISLTVSIFLLILINALVIYKILKKENIPTAAFSCQELSQEIKLQIEKKNKTWELLGDKFLVINYCKYFVETHNKYMNVSFIESDNQTYFMNLISLNLISKELEKLYKQYKKYDAELDNFKSLNTLEKIRILQILKTTQIKQHKIVEPFAKVYSNFFDSNNNYVLSFIVFINFLCLILTIYLMLCITRSIFSNIDKNLSILIILNIFLLPFNFFYYLNFYKEPFIFLSLIMIIFNFIYLLDNNKNFINITLSTFIIFLSLEFIKFFKLPYHMIYTLIFLIGNFILILKLKGLKTRIMIFFQVFLVLILTYSHQYNKIFKNYFYKAFSPISENISKTPVSDLYNKYIKSDKLYFNLQNKTVTKNPSNKKTFNTKEIIANDSKLEKYNNYKHFYCAEPYLQFCTKINTLAYTMYYMKIATMNENKNNPNIVNTNLLDGTKKIILNIPISTVKGFIMPIKFSTNLAIILISIYKISVFLIFIYFLLLLFRAKKNDIFEKIFYVILFLMPLSLAIDLITSNYFTYFRYVMPINILMLVFISFSFIEIFFKKNDKYNS